MVNYTYDNVFLDSQYRDTFIDCCIKDGYISNMRDDYGAVDRDKYVFLPNVKRLYRYLVFFEYVDFADSIYDLSRLIDMGLIKEDSLCTSNLDPEEKFFEDAISIMSVYKRQVINQAKATVKKQREDLSHPSSPNSSYWKTRSSKDMLYYCQESSGKVLQLSRDYYEILQKLDDICGVGDSPEERFLYHIYEPDIPLLLGGIRNSLAYGLKAAEKGVSAYASSVLNINSQIKNQNMLGEVLYFVKTNLPEEANIMPMPQTFRDVIEMRKSPYIKSFRMVMDEWTSYINSNDINAANKMKKDIVRANKSLEKIGKFRRIYNAPITRTIICAGGFVPIIGQVLNVISWAEPYIVSRLEEKSGWVLLSTL